MANSGSATKDQGQGRTFTEKAKDIAQQAGEKAKDAASSVGDMVSSAASSVGKTADKWTSATGSGMKNLGETIEEKGPQGGFLGSASHAVASTLEEGGKYLQQEGLSGMMDDVTNLIRRNPVPAILVGIGLGYLIGRTLGSS